MTGHAGDCCPARGSDELLPYAVIIGAAETYGYKCLTCTTIWTVIHTGTTPDPAVVLAEPRA